MKLWVRPVFVMKSSLKPKCVDPYCWYPSSPWLCGAYHGCKGGDPLGFYFPLSSSGLLSTFQIESDDNGNESYASL